MGQRLLSLKGNKAAWSGVSRLETNDRGRRKFHRLENCYVSQDGSEIRQFPGYGTFIDLTEESRPAGLEQVGFARYVPEAVRPVIAYTSPSDPYRFPQEYDPAVSQSLHSRAKPSCFFGFEQIGNEIYIIGESRFREQPLYDSSRNKLTIAAVQASGGGNYLITLSGVTGVNSATDTGRGLNGFFPGHIVYIDELTLTAGSDADQALVDNELVGKYHEATAISGSPSFLTLRTIASSSVNSGLATSAEGEIHRIRPNRSEVYPAYGVDPYTSIYDNRPDDPDALTSWRITAPVDMLDFSESACYPAWVANRQRDFGDDASTQDAEGIVLYQSGGVEVRGASRREQRRLPYRPNIECALNRIILAAPQYGCMFQIPVLVPSDPEDWASPTSSDIGVPARNNGLFDRPRALGIPKARLIDSLATTANVSPGDPGTTFQYSANISARFGSPTRGITTDGTYKVAISFEDPGTGDEGVASEPIEVVIPPSGYTSYAYTIRLNYIHPGYHFPECSAYKINVYLAVPGDDALAFYGQFEMEEAPFDPFKSGYAISSHFGLEPVTPTQEPALYRSFDLPLLNDTGDLDGVLDPTRLAPQSATMPRGAEACKFIRGVLFSGGSMGNAGKHNQLWRAKASSRYADGNSFWEEDEMHIRAHSILDAAIPSGLSSVDGDSDSGTLGTAGRAFPDAYEGVSVLVGDLFPGGDVIRQVDRVLNRDVPSLFDLEGASIRYWNSEILRLRRDAWNRSRRAGQSPNTADIEITGEDIYYVMPRGQVQIADPGNPNRSNPSFIKLVDPSKGDDTSAFGHLNGSAIFCTRRETYTYSWYRNPAGEEPNQLSNEFGCIASNSMVEFDGGLAWLSARGPVALGQGIQHIGADVAEDFFGQDRIYRHDSTGMMRHSWGVHDANRGLVMWGLLRRDSDQRVSYEGSTYTVETATDEVLSRFPCDEVLIWSYRANAFSHWKPPAGLEVLWMRPLRDKRGYTRMCFLAADGRIYALDDEWSDANSVFNGTQSELEVVASATATSSTTFSFTGAATYKYGDSAGIQQNLAMLLRPGMLVEFLDEDGCMVADSTIDTITTTDQSGGASVIELSAATSWKEGQTVRIGGRSRAKIISTFIGSETSDTMQVQRLQMRYSTRGSGYSNVRVQAFKSESELGGGENARVVDMTGGKWVPVGKISGSTAVPSEIERLGLRKNFSQGEVSAPEVAFQIEITGEAQVRIQDLSLEVG